MREMRVASLSHPKQTGAAIAWALRDEGQISVTVCGMAAVNQAVKALAVSRILLEPNRLDIVVQPTFFELVPRDGGPPRTGIALHVTLLNDEGPVCSLPELTQTALMGDCDD